LDLHFRLRCVQSRAHAQSGRPSSGGVSRSRSVSGRARDHSDAANVLTIKPFDNTDDDNRKRNSLQISFFRSLLDPNTSREIAQVLHRRGSQRRASSRLHRIAGGRKLSSSSLRTNPRRKPIRGIRERTRSALLRCKPLLAEFILLWKQKTPHSQAGDWVFPFFPSRRQTTACCQHACRRLTAARCGEGPHSLVAPGRPRTAGRR
jgi:hypothetical protein